MRKDIERAHGMLVKKFHLLGKAVRFWNETHIKNIVCTCVILHNMVCEERMQELGNNDLSDDDHARYCEASDPRNSTINTNSIFSRLQVVDATAYGNLQDAMARRFARASKLHFLLTDSTLHVQLKKDLCADLIRRKSTTTSG